MVSSATTSLFRHPHIAVMLLAILPAMTSGGSARAEGCSLPPQGEGHVADVVDGRSFHLADGREIVLAGIEPAASDATKANRAAVLSAVIADHDVTLHGEDDTPDRYGRQPALVFLAGSEIPVQALLLAQGAALVSADIADKGCAASLFAAEAEARALMHAQRRPLPLNQFAGLSLTRPSGAALALSRSRADCGYVGMRA